jgi:hypothetical protein
LNSVLALFRLAMFYSKNAETETTALLALAPWAPRLLPPVTVEGGEPLVRLYTNCSNGMTLISVLGPVYIRSRGRGYLLGEYF